MDDSVYVYVLVVHIHKPPGLDISIFKDLDVAKKSKSDSDEISTGWVEKNGALYCLHSPDDEDWFIFKKRVI